MLYRQIFKLGFRKSYEYRTNFYMGLVSTIFPLTIQFFLWAGLFENADGGIVFGYTFIQMISYAVFAVMTTKMISPSFVYEINTEIKEGGLAKYLVKPLSYFKYHFMGYLGEKIGIILCASILVIGFWAGVSWWSDTEWQVTRLILYFASLIQGLILNFTIFYGISSMGFWMIDASGAIFITTLVGTIVSGGIFPLDIFGQGIQAALNLLPFPYTSYFSVSILCGTVGSDEIVAGFMLQLFWITVCGILARTLWKIGIKRYIAVGG